MSVALIEHMFRLIDDRDFEISATVKLALGSDSSSASSMAPAASPSESRASAARRTATSCRPTG